MAMTINGFLPEENEALMQWIKTDRRGFYHWREKATFILHPHYPLVDLLHAKNRHDHSCVYLAEIQNTEAIEFLRGLFHYNIADEIVLYLLPVFYGKGNMMTDNFRKSLWKISRTHVFPNGICRIVYQREKITLS